MIPGSKDPLERANLIKKLEERWLVKSREREISSLKDSPKKTRTSLTNPVARIHPFNKGIAKGQSG